MEADAAHCLGMKLLKNTLLLVSLSTAALLVGCDKTISKSETTKTSTDGTMQSKETTVTQKSDGTIQKTEETKKTTPNP